MNKLLLWVGSIALKKLLTPQAMGSSQPRFDFDYLEDQVRRYAITGALAVLALVFFAAGVLVTLVSLALSYDQYGTISPGAVFYTGLGLGALSAVALVACVRSFQKNRFSRVKFFQENQAA